MGILSWSWPRATAFTELVWPVRVYRRSPVRRSQTIAVLSLLVVTAMGILSWSWPRATAFTELVWPVRVYRRSPVRRSQTIAVLSLLVVTAMGILSWSWPRATAFTHLVWPVRVCLGPRDERPVAQTGHTTSTGSARNASAKATHPCCWAVKARKQARGRRDSSRGLTMPKTSAPSQ